jgi:hypothetical protein
MAATCRKQTINCVCHLKGIHYDLSRLSSMHPLTIYHIFAFHFLDKNGRLQPLPAPPPFPPVFDLLGYSVAAVGNASDGAEQQQQEQQALAPVGQCLARC